MSGLNVVFDFVGNLIVSQDSGFESLPTTSFGPRSPMPTHYTTGAGGTYSLLPEMSRPGIQVVAARSMPFVVPVVASAVIADAMVADYQHYVVDRMPEHQRQGAWHTYASMLTGTFGIGSGLNL